VHEEAKFNTAASETGNLSIIEIYEQFHDAEAIKSMTVIEIELARCKNILPALTDAEMKETMEDRIEVLLMN
jgi:hypothetical protein